MHFEIETKTKSFKLECCKMKLVSRPGADSKKTYTLVVTDTFKWQSQLFFLVWWLQMAFIAIWYKVFLVDYEKDGTLSISEGH